MTDSGSAHGSDARTRAATETTAPDGASPYRVLVPLANPRTERDLVELATRIASQREAAEHSLVVIGATERAAPAPRR